MTVTAQQIVYTDHPESWQALATALGLVAPFPPSAEWAEFDGDGVLAIHRASDGRRPGAVDLHLLVDDLDAAEAALAAFGPVRGEMAGVGELLTVTAASGLAVTLSVRERPCAGGDRTIAMQPIWFQPDLDEPRRILEALGMRPDVAADGGGWLELAADGGMVGLHHGEEPRIGLSLLARGDLDVLAERLRAAGFDAVVIDEAFGRTVRLPDPDGGEDLWINGVQDDLYGYHRIGDDG
jgi:hypothetical protein